MTGRKADVILAAHLCAEAALRLVKPGNQVSAEAPLGQASCAWSHLELHTTLKTSHSNRLHLEKFSNITEKFLR